jgi:hypothetical protein
MTRPDLGAERPGHPSETRQWAEDMRRHTTEVSGKRFWVALVIIVAALVGYALLLYAR